MKGKLYLNRKEIKNEPIDSIYISNQQTCDTPLNFSCDENIFYDDNNCSYAFNNNIFNNELNDDYCNIIEKKLMINNIIKTLFNK